MYKKLKKKKKHLRYRHWVELGRQRHRHFQIRQLEHFHLSVLRLHWYIASPQEEGHGSLNTPLFISRILAPLFYKFRSPFLWHNITYSGWGALNFFQVGVCGPDFWSVGLANWYLPLKRGGACELKMSKFWGLWIESVKIWGFVSWKFPNLGTCELKFGWK